MEERWRGIRGWPGYQVSDRGRVRSMDRRDSQGHRLKGKVLRPAERNAAGHMSVCLRRGGARQSAYVHRLVLEAFVGPCPDGQQCRHLDGNPANNTVANLSWGTPKQNGRDAARTNGALRHPNATLTAAQVREIRRMRSAGASGPALAGRFDVTHNTIYSIVNRRTWRWLR